MKLRKVAVSFETLILLLFSLSSISCGGGGTSTASPTSSPTPQNITVTVTPPSATIAPGGSQLYTATVSGTSNTGVTWNAGGVQGGNATVGTITSSGLYTAPAAVPNPSSVTIAAISVADGTKSGTAIADVRAHHDNQDLQPSPIKLGASGGNRTDQTTSNGKIFCCSGTLGALISRGGRFYVLSNNHVLDKSDQGATGDPISHPGLADSNCGQNDKIVANLSQAAALTTSNVDAAMAQIVPGQVDTGGTILDLAAVAQPAPPSAAIAAPALGQPVAKSGDATGLTCSTVNAINANVKVDYSTQCQGGTSFSVTFANQIAISGANFSNSGDSGSLIVTSDTARPVALLYAGNSAGTVGNPIQDVLSALKDPMTSEVPRVVGGGDHAIACPAAAQSNVIAREQVLATARLSDSEVARATAARNRRAIELMQDPAVTAVEVGQSDDNTKESALIVFLKSQPRIPVPVQVDGVRTKIVMGSDLRAQTRVASLPEISESEVVRARVTKEHHADELMANPAILGVGVGASNDNPSEAAIVVFVEQGKSASVPPQIDGVRTRIVITDRFRTFNWGKSTVKACSRR